MPKLNAARGSQAPQVAEFVFSFDDTMTDTSGALRDFKTVGPGVFDVINLPAGMVVVGGSVTTETAVTGSTAYNVSVGDSALATRYLAATDRLAAGTTALVPTGYVGLGENLRITVNPTIAAATAGKVSVRVQYITRGRMTEVQTH